MLKVCLERFSKINRDTIFALSTNIEEFSKIMPKYFKSLKITSLSDSELFVSEEINFLGFSINVKTKHKISPPNLHEINILSGPLRNSVILEKYEEFKNGTKVMININLELNGFAKLFLIFGFFLERKINKVMDEFIISCENQSFNFKSKSWH